MITSTREPRWSFDWQAFISENITRSWWLTAWLLLLTYLTARFAIGQWRARPLVTTLLVLVWAVSLGLTLWRDARHRHTDYTRWLKANLYGSITSALVTLVIALGLVAAATGLYRYGFTTASFATVPATDFRAEVERVSAESYCFRIGHIEAASGPNTLLEPRQACFTPAQYAADLSRDDPAQVQLGAEAASFCFDEIPGDPDNGVTCFASTAQNPGYFTVTYTFSGANWGAVGANLTTLMVFRFSRDELWRVWLAVFFLIGLSIPSLIIFRGRWGQRARRPLTYLWYASPLLLYVLLRGVPAVPFSTASLGAIISGILSTLLRPVWPALPATSGWLLILALLAPILLTLNYWLAPRWGEPETFTGLARYARLTWQLILVGTALALLVTALRLIIPLVWANRNLFGLLIAPLIFYLWRYVNRRYPAEKGESEALRLGRIALSALYGLALVLAVLAVLSLVWLIVGSITFRGEQVFRALDPNIDWGGFLLTLIITAFAIVVSFPLGVVLALGRRSQIPGIPAWLTYLVAFAIMLWGLQTQTPSLAAAARNGFELALAYWPVMTPVLAFAFQRTWNGNVVAAFSTLYIEFIRGIPLITVLFLTIILFPIFLPANVEILGIWRVMWGFTLFSAAYLAENVRGGLQAIPRGQYEAADSLGLSTLNKYRLIILPQALRIVIPAITNQYIGLFKDTTLVAIVGLLDILGVANAIAAQPAWLGVRREAYLFIAVLYYIISAVMAGYSARLERRTGLGVR